MAGNRTYSTVEIESPRTICAGDQMRRLLYSSSSDRYVINVRNESGDIIRRIERPYQALPFTRIDIEEYGASYEDYKNEEMKKMLSSMSMPDKKNVIADLFVDDRGYLWVLTNEKKKEPDNSQARACVDFYVWF